jgi:hypothetical protein
LKENDGTRREMPVQIRVMKKGGLKFEAFSEGVWMGYEQDWNHKSEMRESEIVP